MDLLTVIWTLCNTKKGQRNVRGMSGFGVRFPFKRASSLTPKKVRIVHLQCTKKKTIGQLTLSDTKKEHRSGMTRTVQRWL